MASYRSPKVPPFSGVRALIERTVRDVADQELSDFANSMRERLVKGINQQRFVSFRQYPLNPKYKAWKEYKGYDLRVLIATGRYINNIKVFKLGTAKYEVNLPKGKMVTSPTGKTKKITYRELASILENGSAAANIPPRKHWGVVYRQGLQEAPGIAKKIATKAARQINRSLKRGVR